MELEVKYSENYAHGNTKYNLPIEIGYFSINSDGEYCDDNHQLKYLSMPDELTGLNLDLNEGFEDYIHIHEHAEGRFKRKLRWILSHEDVIRKHFADSSFQGKSKIDFVLNRGALTSAASTLYQKSDDWEIHATKFRSVIYMDKIRQKRDAPWIKEMGEKGKRMPTWGFKFEQYITSDTMDSRPNTSVPVNENEKYYAVMKGELNEHSMILSAEVDAVDPEYFKKNSPDSTSVLRYVEFKTSKLMASEKQRRNFKRFKLINWYLQSYFAGIPRVICGFRDDEGIVKKVDSYNVRDMPKIAAGAWSGPSCVNFCSEFLNFVKTCGMKDDPKVVYKIYYKPGYPIICEELPELPPEELLLPDWYTERVTVI